MPIIITQNGCFFVVTYYTIYIMKDSTTPQKGKIITKYGTKWQIISHVYSTSHRDKIDSAVC